MTGCSRAIASLSVFIGSAWRQARDRDRSTPWPSASTTQVVEADLGVAPLQSLEDGATFRSRSMAQILRLAHPNAGQEPP